MNMKLSYRDKIIFIVVVVIIVLIGGFFVFIKPKITESNDVKANLVEKENERQQTQDKMDTLEPLKTQLKNNAAEVDKTQDKFLDEETAYLADQEIYKIISDAAESTGGNIKFVTMSLTGENKGQLSDYFYIRNSCAYDLKMNADITGDSLPQEVYDAYYETNPKGAEAVDVAVEEIVVEVGFELVEDEYGTALDWTTLGAVIDALSDSDQSIYLKVVEEGEAVEKKEIDVAEGTVVEEEPNFYGVQFTVDRFSIGKLDTTLVTK